MPKYAVLNNNKVTNIIMADTLEVAEEVTKSTCIETEVVHVLIGYTYNETTNTFTNPEVTE